MGASIPAFVRRRSEYLSLQGKELKYLFAMKRVSCSVLARESVCLCVSIVC